MDPNGIDSQPHRMVIHIHTRMVVHIHPRMCMYMFIHQQVSVRALSLCAVPPIHVITPSHMTPGPPYLARVSRMLAAHAEQGLTIFSVIFCDCFDSLVIDLKREERRGEKRHGHTVSQERHAWRRRASDRYIAREIQ